MIEARGHVRIFKGENRATSEHALYYKQEEKVILRGLLWLGRKEQKISGPKMTMYLRENKSIVEGERGWLLRRAQEINQWLCVLLINYPK